MDIYTLMHYYSWANFVLFLHLYFIFPFLGVLVILESSIFMSLSIYSFSFSLFLSLSFFLLSLPLSLFLSISLSFFICLSTHTHLILSSSISSYISLLSLIFGRSFHLLLLSLLIYFIPSNHLQTPRPSVLLNLFLFLSLTFTSSSLCHHTYAAPRP